MVERRQRYRRRRCGRVAGVELAAGTSLSALVQAKKIAAVPDGAISSLVDVHIAILPARLFKAGTLLYAAMQPSSPGIGENRDRYQ